MPQPDAVQVVEVGPRDGLQNERVLVSTANKVEMVRRAIDAGHTRIEATAFVHPRLVPQMADAEELMRALPRPAGVRYAGLVLNERGLERALHAGVDEVNVVVVATDTFSQRNQGVSVADMLAIWERVASRAHSGGVSVTATVAAAFGCPFEGEVSPEVVGAIVERLADGGAHEIALADTIGVGVPTQVHHLAGVLEERAPEVTRRFHFHNTRNTGYANALQAVRDGVKVLDASTGGIGGCPFAPAATGNIATEDLVYALERSDISTGLDLATLLETAEWTGAVLRERVPGQLSRAGAFPPP